jgi:hypothetical protein
MDKAAQKYFISTKKIPIQSTSFQLCSALGLLTQEFTYASMAMRLVTIHHNSLIQIEPRTPKAKQ